MAAVKVITRSNPDYEVPMMERGDALYDGLRDAMMSVLWFVIIRAVMLSACPLEVLKCHPPATSFALKPLEVLPDYTRPS